jgi:hypothetical protein
MGFGIPIGAEFNDIEKAIRSYDIFSRFEIFLNLTHGYELKVEVYGVLIKKGVKNRLHLM